MAPLQRTWEDASKLNVVSAWRRWVEEQAKLAWRESQKYLRGSETAPKPMVLNLHFSVENMLNNVSVKFGSFCVDVFSIVGINFKFSYEWSA